MPTTDNRQPTTKTNKLIFLIGMPGAGKTTIGRQLSSLLQMPFIDLDEYIVSKQGQSIPALFAAGGESHFRQLEAEALREVAAMATGAIVATGGGTPCFLDNMDFMNAQGTTVFLQMPVEVVAERLMIPHGRQQRPLVAGKTPEQIKQFVTETYHSRLQFYQKAQITYQNPSREITELSRLIRSLENYC
jgi:shikimate kinase